MKIQALDRKTKKRVYIGVTVLSQTTLEMTIPQGVEVLLIHTPYLRQALDAAQKTEEILTYLASATLDEIKELERRWSEATHKVAP
jgi:hypothetical protein